MPTLLPKRAVSRAVQIAGGKNDDPHLTSSFMFHLCAIVSIFPESGSFNVDNVRVCKIPVRILFFFTFVCVFNHVLLVSNLQSVLFSGLWRDGIIRASWNGL